jgi:ATP-dependent protease ClpP protease subunit
MSILEDYENPSKRVRYDNNCSSQFYDRYEKSIFVAGDNEIHFNTEVSGETIARMKKLISTIIDNNKDNLVRFDTNHKVPKGQEKYKEFMITYIVNSPGGSVHDILDFVDYISLLRDTYYNLRFTSIITGRVASAGTTMCIIADKRKMTRFASAMIHELSTGCGYTNFTKIVKYTEHCKDLHDKLVRIYQECRGIDIKNEDETRKLETLLLKETWMNAEQYLENGFVDEIIAKKLKL